MRKLTIEKELVGLLAEKELTTSEVSERLAVSISTASKYLEALKREGRVTERAAGPAKLWRAAKALGDFEQVRRGLTHGSGAVRLFDRRVAIAPAESFGALARVLGRDEALAAEALYAMGVPLGEHAAAVTMEQTGAEGEELAKGALSYLGMKGWGAPVLLEFGSGMTVKLTGGMLGAHAGKRKTADHVVAGALAGLFRGVTGADAVCTERQCAATGAPHCEFVVERR